MTLISADQALNDAATARGLAVDDPLQARLFLADSGNVTLMTHTAGATVLDRLLEPVGRSITPELAREIVALRVDPALQDQIDNLAEKCNEGVLSPEERAEYEQIVGAIHLIGILQKKARRILANGGAP